ncbi:MAG: aldehyde dehydrogenase [Clostridia bacterium]|nr:aldehyde dehydrogenase [Clostridia bacterium]
MTTNIDKIIEKQREFFFSSATLSVKFRKEALIKLKEAILRNIDKISLALKEDLGKSKYESYMCEIGMALSEIGYMIKHVKKLSKPRRVRTPMAQFPSKSFVLPCPYGNTLVMSPWNYPFLLTVDPVATAIAAGNTVVVKPSAYSPATSAVIKELFAECFDETLVATVTGGRAENAELLSKKFDFIFFTGSSTVGKEVLRRSAENLTPAVLELGGKSPCIVDSTAKISLAARRIVFGKFLNCGQTCVAPDYILCHSSVKEALIDAIRREIARQYGEGPLENEKYGKIITEKHFDRLLSLIDTNKTVIGGSYSRDSLKIEPTVLDRVLPTDAVMAEEIFGPILPILTFDDISEVISFTRPLPKPLALYMFSESKENIKAVTSRISYGGGCINDCIIHLATSNMGFGGVGESGMGSYHGRVGFDTFSHLKSIVKKSTRIDLPMRYAPYDSKLNEKLLKFFLK